jgi:16S rRNA processing protein RimM
MSDFVAIGKVSGAVGIKGEVKIIRWTDAPGRFSLLKSVWLGFDFEHAREFEVQGVRVAGKSVALKLSNVESRSVAEQLANQLVMVPSSKRVQPPEGTFFVDDVLGLEVVTEEGKRVGVVRDVLRLPSSDLWQVDTGVRVVSIPAVKEFIRVVDIAGQRVVIHEVEGLLDV